MQTIILAPSTTESWEGGNWQWMEKCSQTLGKHIKFELKTKIEAILMEKLKIYER